MYIIKHKKINKIILTALSVFLWAFSYSAVFSADVGLFPSSKEYRVGDIIKINVSIKSDKSVNAISSTISFPKDLISVSGISKDGSIVSLWAKEPSFSNNTGNVSFEGVMLNGFIGSSGKIVTLNFRAKDEGIANIYFDQASILANDGNGTEVISGKNSTTITIKEAIVQPTDNTKIEEKPKETELPKEVILKIKEIEQSNNLPENILIILIILLIILILVILVIYLIHHINKIRFLIKKRLDKIEKEIENDEPSKKVLKDIDDIEKEI